MKGESTPRQPDGRRPRDGRAPATASSVLTPPTGQPSVPQAPLPPVPPVARAAEPVVGACLCSHPREAHEHYRRGSDCGVCGASICSAYRPRGGRLRRVLRALGLVR